jgi:hypothetical protein
MTERCAVAILALIIVKGLGATTFYHLSCECSEAENTLTDYFNKITHLKM